MATTIRAAMDLFDVTAKSDLHTSCNVPLQPFGDLAHFKEEVAPWDKYLTLEPDRFVLDGSMAPLPDDMTKEQWCLWTADMSDENGRFSTPVELDFQFTTNHASVGLTFYFDVAADEYASEMLVQWFGGSGLELSRMKVRPDSGKWFLANNVEGYQRVLVTVYSTSRPHRYLKMAGIEFGVRRQFTKEDILTASLLEEYDPISSELRSGSLELSVYNTEPFFSMLNAQGFSPGLQQRQRIVLTGFVDGDELPLGTYYLSEWDCTSDTISNFTATDSIDLLDNAPFEGGIYNTTAGSLAATILDGYPYTLDENLAGTAIHGWLPYSTRREALQQLVFAIGAVVDTTRDGVIKIQPPRQTPSRLVTKREKFNGSSSISRKPMVTGVQVTAHSYATGGEVEELSKSTLTVGQHTILFGEPAYGYTIQGGTLVTTHPNFVVVNVATEREVTISGRKYIDTAVVVEQDAEALPFNSEPNVMTVDAATLVSPALAPQVARRLLEYAAHRYEQTFKIRLDDERLGDSILAEALNHQYLRGNIERLDIDLSGGFLATVTLSGEQVDRRTGVYFTGEFYTNDGGVA